jgi:flagellar biosynthesis protein FliR
VFFVGLPIQIIGGLSVLALALPAIMFSAINYFQGGLSFFIDGN